MPVYLGIREFSPAHVHLIFSDESVSKLAPLKPLFPGIKWAEYKCDAFDFFAVKAICEKIITSLGDGDSITFNLTSGTKVMMLACQSVILEKNLSGFYVSQDLSLLQVPKYNKKQISFQLSIKDFFDLSEHSIASCNKLDDFTKEDFIVAAKIETFAGDGQKYLTIMRNMRKIYNDNDLAVPETGRASVSNSNMEVTWRNDSVIINNKGKNILNLKSKHVRNLFFSGGWWELIVAKEIAGWASVKELLVNCILPFKTDTLTSKNEIDILINTGKSLIFVECKSGNIRQEDINKMKVIKQTYGGVIAKSILVSKFPPSGTIQEKCKELDIHVFYTHMFNKQVKSLSKLIVEIDTLSKRSSIN